MLSIFNFIFAFDRYTVLILPLLIGMFLSLQVSDKSPSNMSGSYSVPLTWGELQVIRSILQYSIPKLLAFDRIWDNSFSMNADTSSNSSPKFAAQPRSWP